jgi:hypothetical protein
VQEAELNEALILIEKCTGEQVTKVLRKYKDTRRVKITADNKEDLIRKNLRCAVQDGIVTKADIFDLIRESEENGSQHIWYFRPKRGLAHLFEANAVAERLFGPTWQIQVAAYPSLYLKPEDYVISDFRTSARKPKDWYIKIYGHATLQKATGNRDPRENGVFWLEYQTVPLRTVILVRWNSPDLLEIRVQRDESRKRVERWLDTAWKFLRPAFLREQFTPWSLEQTLGNLVQESEKHKELYDFRDVKVLEHEGKIMATYEPVLDTGSLFDSKDTIRELKRKLTDGGTLKGLAVTWLSGKTAFDSNLRTLIAVKNENEAFVPAHCSAKDLDHATDQLRRFS